MNLDVSIAQVEKLKETDNIRFLIEKEIFPDL